MKNQVLKFKNANHQYSIIIGNNALNHLPNKINSICPNTRKVALIVDKNIPGKFINNLRKKLKKYELIVTRGSKGAEYKNVLYETEPVEVYDVCGAGDTFFASLVYRFLMTDDIVDSIKFANKCAKITVTKEGTYAPKLSEVLKQ